MTDHTPHEGVVIRMRPEDVTTLWIYGGVSAALVVAFVVLENVTWPYGNAQLHTITEVIATLFALIVGVVITIEGRILGTPAYMPPEQARGPPMKRIEEAMVICWA